MKKITTIVIFILLLFLSACTTTEVKVREKTIYGYMSTYLKVRIKTKSESEFNTFLTEIESIYSHVHEVSDYVYAPTKEGVINNLYTINQKMNEDVTQAHEFEIDQVLFEMLTLADLYRVQTDGYFNVGIGYHIDVWKDFMEDIRESSLTIDAQRMRLYEAQEAIKKRTIREESYQLSQRDNQYFVTVFAGVLLDFGAFAKGYGTQKVVEYIHSKAIDTYSVDGGSSALSYGLNDHKDRDYYNIGLQDPLDANKQYGILKNLQHINVATSGSYESYNFVELDGIRYHHIISAKTGMPINHYLTVTIIGLKAGELDPYSTAIFAMNEEEVIDFIERNQLKMDYILYQFGGIIKSRMTEFGVIFEEK